MANTFVVCLLSAALFCCADLTSARQIKKECSKGPEYWCQSLKSAADCGAVGHCTGDVWSKQQTDIHHNVISDRFIKMFEQLKDVKDLINMGYLASRVRSECTEVPHPTAAAMCRDNTAFLEKYLIHVLASDVTPENMCRIIGMCNNMKLDNLMALQTKRAIGKVTTSKPALLGSERCTWGPSYWCTNITTGHECKATRHCIDRVWSKMEVKQDTDDICKICTDMVTQARDQLQSNETQEELKEVFEGSCQLIPIKIIAKECINLADEFVPDLVETLASEMNPQTVCSVAGLCNNARIDRLLEDYHEVLKKHEECGNCKSGVTGIRARFDSTTYDDFLVALLKACRRLDSLSDSCSMLVFKYYENIIEAVKRDLKPDSVCHISGQCAYQYHTHDEYTFPNKTATELEAQNDVPCEFCEQLIVHMRNILIANTTEMQFYKILTGLCKQTGNFKTECLHLADEYYPVIYKFLETELKPKEICSMMGVCPNFEKDVIIAPLVPRELAVKVVTPRLELIGTDEANSYSTEKQSNVLVLGQEPAPAPLPIERMFISLPQNKVACSFCQYFLHYLQVELSDSNTEDEIKSAVDKACGRLPDSVKGECEQFVTEYGPAVIALLVQEIDPASVCPAIGLCPLTHEVQRVAINSGKSNCPLCLFAVEQLEAMLQSNRTESSIRNALEHLCGHLSQKLRTECVDFVDTYSQQLITMLVSDMDAQQICVYLKLCSDTVQLPADLEPQPSVAGNASPIDKFFQKPELRADRNNHKKPFVHQTLLEGDIETNEIPDHTVNGRPIKPEVSQKTVCVVCEFVLREIDDQIKDKHNDDEIKKVVHGICKHMPKSVRADCDQFVEKYADLVISLLAQELSPDQVCQELKLCTPAGVTRPDLERAKEAILDCAVCETVVMAVKKVLENDKVDRNIVHIVERSCALLPAKYNDRCHTLMEIYGNSVIQLIEELGTKGVCQKIGLCSAREGVYLNMYRESQPH